MGPKSLFTKGNDGNLAFGVGGRKEERKEGEERRKRAELGPVLDLALLWSSEIGT